MTKPTSNSSLAGISNTDSRCLPCGASRRGWLAHLPVPGLALMLLACLLTGCGLSRQHLHPETTPDGNWPTVRGDARNTGVAESSRLRIDRLLWDRKTGGVATSEPSVHGGLLFFPGRDRRLEIFATRDGDRLYRERFAGPVNGVVPNDTGFVVTVDQNEQRLIFYSYDPVRRVTDVKIPISPVPPRELPDGSVLVTGFHGSLTRVAPDGSEIWSVETGGVVQSAPACRDSIILVASGRAVTARRLRDGSQAWRALAAGAVIAAPSVDDRVYFGSSDSLVYAVSLTDGSMDWFFSTSGQVLTSPVVGENRVYIACNDRNIYALNKSNGKLVWSFDTGAPAKWAPTLVGDHLVVGTQTAKLLILKAATGEVLKSFDLRWPAAIPPVVADGKVFISDTRRRLYCFGPADSATVITDTNESDTP